MDSRKSMAQTILIVDDKDSVRQLLREYLEEQGFVILTAMNGADALLLTHKQTPNLVLLDLMMPEMDGYTFLRFFRQESSTPVIIITAREEETDAVQSLDLGADDYIIKPFRMRELLARIHAVLRRADSDEGKSERLRVGDILLDRAAHTVLVNGNSVTLTPLEFDLLAVLMRSPGQVFTRSQLVDHLLDSGFNGLDRTLNVHIRNLRTKIEPDPANPEWVETVFGVGYRFRKVG